MANLSAPALAQQSGKNSHSLVLRWERTNCDRAPVEGFLLLLQTCYDRTPARLQGNYAITPKELQSLLEKLPQWRVRHGLTPEKLAIEFGSNRNSVNRWEKENYRRCWMGRLTKVVAVLEAHDAQEIASKLMYKVREGELERFN